MLFRAETLAGIESGAVTVAFRRWRRPTVRSGGTLTTAVGVLRIDGVERVREETLTAEDARRAGYASLAALRTELAKRSEGVLYRIDFHVKGPDPRLALRERVALDDEEREGLRARLRRLDAASESGPWTRGTLEIIAGNPGIRAADIAPLANLPRDAFKRNVRKLKNLGLTESLGTGYRLSPRGRVVLEAVAGSSPAKNEI